MCIHILMVARDLLSSIWKCLKFNSPPPPLTSARFGSIADEGFNFLMDFAIRMNPFSDQQPRSYLLGWRSGSVLDRRSNFFSVVVWMNEILGMYLAFRMFCLASFLKKLKNQFQAKL